MEKDKGVSSVEKIISVEKSKFLSYCIVVLLSMVGYFGSKSLEVLKEMNEKISGVYTAQAVDHQKLIDHDDEIKDLQNFQQILQEGEKKNFVSIPNIR